MSGKTRAAIPRPARAPESQSGSVTALKCATIKDSLIVQDWYIGVQDGEKGAKNQRAICGYTTHVMVDISRPDDGLRELALFAGAGGGILGGSLLGWRTVCAVELDPYAASVLVSRQNDGILPPFPIWDDVCTFDGRPWRGIVDVVSGGFPCQDISAAGTGAGIDGDRSGLWSHMARIIGEVRPRYAFIENSPALASRGLNRVLADLAALGLDAEWGIVSAADCGAPHLRERIWIVSHVVQHRRGTGADQPERLAGSSRAAYAGDDGEEESLADSNGSGCQQRTETDKAEGTDHAECSGHELANAKSDGRQQGRAESARIEGRSEAGGAGEVWR